MMMAGGTPNLWRNLLVAALISIALVSTALWFGTEYRRTADTTAAVNLSFRQRLAIESVFSEMKDGETGQRGYVITGNPDFLQPYNKALREMDGTLANLSQLLKNEPGTARDLQILRQLIEQKFVEMKRVIDVRQRQGLNAAASVVMDGRGKQLMDSLRTHVSKMVMARNAALAQDLESESNRTVHTLEIIWGGVALASLAAFIIAYMLWASRRDSYTAQRQAMDHLTRQTAIFKNTPSPVILINPSGSMEILNPAAEHLFGYPSTDLLRRDISIIANIAPGEGAFLDRLGVTGDHIAEPSRPNVGARRSDGSVVPVDITLGVMPLEDGIHIVASFSDISEREKIERMKDQFLSTVSHELRTPLTSIVGSLGLLRGGVAEELAPGAQRLVVIAESNANRLIRIVNDLLDVEKLQSGQMTFDFQPLDLRTIVEKAADAMRGLSATRNIRIEIGESDGPVIVRGDGDRLIQVVTNLVSNAVKFSPEGSTVSVLCGTQGSHANIRVADQGPGIEPGLRERLFTRFAQGLGSSTSATQGTGLGLAISREIVRNHGGDIWLEDAAGGGSVFAFNIPLWNVLTGQEDLNGAPRLLVYADAVGAETISAGFAEREIRADAVSSPEAALAAIEGRSYVAMVLDFQFAADDALPLLGVIRSHPRARNLPVIAISSEDPPLEAAQTASLDIIDWIEKPIQSARLSDAIESAIKRTSGHIPLVLHVDDDSDLLEITAKALSGLARIAQATDVASARAFLAEHRVDIAIIDLALPDGSGHDILADLNARQGPATPVIIYSAQDGGLALARDVEAVLTKSKRSLPNLVETVLSIVERRKGEEGL
ncbi:CHASE3 domain-containing protein [Sphingobium phenoxybenzoativorans]|uniref:histidine kinase n=2 Tax=Sphingobium phenoxybenzoativorans TaxID=1592790 RepID=A0A975Q112_9SPHN|nr:CHASE3 domain-containing protein [Sphingobium phenoxybenzoativorans]